MANTFNLGNGSWAQKTEKLLAFNSENDNYKPLPFDFDRASSATRVNKQGLIETVGTDKPRIDFLNNTKGHLLLEPQRQNVVTYSEKADEWGRNNSQIPTLDTSINNPYGVAGAYTTSGNGTANFPQYSVGSISPTSSGTATASVFFKQFEAPYIYVLANGVSIGGSSFNSLYKFTFATETLTKKSGGTAESTSVQDYGNGWYRVILTYTYDGTANFNFRIRNYDGSTEKTEIGTSKTYAWGGQFEEGSYATSYIPTQGSAVTRSAETCNGAGNSNVFNDSEGVLYAEFAALTEGGTSRRITISDGDTSNRVVIENDEQSGRYRFFISGGGTTITLTHKTGVTEKNYNKIAVSWNGANSKVYFNGEKTTPETTDTPTISGLSVLQLQNSQATGSNLEGKVKDVRVYNTALTDAELIALTS